jgi:lysophospholipase L1-like esterase
MRVSPASPDSQTRTDLRGMAHRLAALVLVSVCALSASAASAGAPSHRLRRLVVVGDSLLAGFGSGALVERGGPGQVDSAPAFIARRARVSLSLPAIQRPGIPSQLVIRDANHNRRLDPGEVGRPDSDIGFRRKRGTRARNLAVPGEDMRSVFDGISPAGLAGRLISGQDVEGRDILKLLVLGFPLDAHEVSQPSLARDLHPSFVLVWIGNNDVLGMATDTDPSAVTMPQAEFASRYRRLLEAIADGGPSGMAVANLPDVTKVAALRRAAGEVTSCRTAAGGTAPVAPDDLLSIDLDRRLLPTPPCSKVLDASERGQIQATVASLNGAIADAAAAVEHERGIPIVVIDTFALFDRIAAEGVDLNGDGTPELGTGYLGGVFSLDGVHPTRTGNALVANAFIDAIDERFGETIPRVNVAAVASHDRLAHSRFRPVGEPPFGVIAGDADDVSGGFDKTFADVKAGAKKIGRELRAAFSDVADLF